MGGPVQKVNPAMTQPNCNGIWTFKGKSSNNKPILIRVTTKNGKFYSKDTPCEKMDGMFNLFKAEPEVFKSIGATTVRSSCSKPNQTNMPKVEPETGDKS